MMKRLRTLFDDAVIGWPDAETNLGRLAGLSEANLRADAFIRFTEHQAVVVEWQSKIHTKEGSKSSWFDHDEIQGRDDLKRQICAKAGIALLELWTLDIPDEHLKGMVVQAAANSKLTDTAVAVLDEEKPPTFAKSDLGIGNGELTTFTAGPGFAKQYFTTGDKPEWKTQKFSSRTSFK